MSISPIMISTLGTEAEQKSDRNIRCVEYSGRFGLKSMIVLRVCTSKYWTKDSTNKVLNKLILEKSL